MPWQQATDPSSGKPYYYNSDTGVTQWDTPAELAAPSAMPPPPQAASVGALPPDWVEEKDPSTNKSYYYNRTTRVTTWERPQAQAPVSPTRRPPRASTVPTAVANQLTGSSSSSRHMPPPSYDQAQAQEMPMRGSEIFAAGVPKLSSARMSSMIGGPGSVAAGSSVPASASMDEKMRLYTSAASSPSRHAPMPATVGGRPVTEEEMQSMREKQAFQQSHTLLKYAETHMSLHKSGIFGKKTLQEMMQHTASLLSKPLLKEIKDKPEVAAALQVFRNITGFMGDRKTSKPKPGHIEKIMRIALMHSDHIRDEIYMQLMKQLTNNTTATSVKAGWELMALCTGIFKPSTSFAAFVDVFLQKGEVLPDRAVAKLAKYAGTRLHDTLANGNRQYPPIQLEVDAVERMKPIPLRIEFPDDTFKTLAVESQSTVGELVTLICKKKQLPNDGTFSIFQLALDHGDFLSERFLEDDSRLMDVVASWYLKRAAFMSAHPKGDLKFKLVYKAKIFRSSLVESAPSHMLQMLFIQGANDIVSGRLVSSDAQAFELAALQLQGTFGDDPPGSFLADHLDQFLPRKIIQQREFNHAGQVMSDRNKFAGVSREDAQRNYLRYLVSTWPNYGSIFFPAEQIQPPPAKRGTIHIAINEQAIFVLDHATKAINARYNLDHLQSYGYREARFWFSTGSVQQSTRYEFQSKVAREMCLLLKIYVPMQ